jgi:hypothetical protein
LYFAIQNTVFKGRLEWVGMLWVFWMLALVAGLALKLGFGGALSQMLAIALLAQGMAFRLLSFVPEVNNYPFSLGWSEASRYYYASLLFSEHLYGQDLPLSFLHPTRYFLQSIPFLMDGVPLWFHRLWQVILWIGTTALTSALLARRLRLETRLLGWLLAMWFFLYLFQGAVYYHLQVCIWIVFLGVSPRRPWQTLGAVLLASIWAGMSRVNWFPIPAMLAVGLTLLEVPVGSRSAGVTRIRLRYLLWPAVWLVAGTAAAFASQTAYIYLSGNSDNIAAFGSSFTSDLLWERLWSNATFPLGILPGILLVSAPMVAIIIQYGVTKGRTLDPLRWLGLVGMLVVLFAGGLVVSVKIGGGGDLHNMDGYMTLLGVVCAYLFFDRAAAEAAVGPSFRAHYALALFAMLVPISFAIQAVKPGPSLDHERASEALNALQRFTRTTVEDGGQVLFIDQRHLLTVGLVRDAPLVSEYELLTLMEMAMSDNQPYLQQFYENLEGHRFDAIIAGGQPVSYKSGTPFDQENNVWAERISPYIRCTYRVGEPLPEVGIQILIPRKQNRNCPSQ